MAVSLLNVLVADKVNALLDDPHVRDNLPDDQRGFTREQATAIIHAALWAYAARAGSTAEAYARMGLFEAIRLKTWSFKEPEQPAPETRPAPEPPEKTWDCVCGRSNYVTSTRCDHCGFQRATPLNRSPEHG